MMTEKDSFNKTYLNQTKITNDALDSSYQNLILPSNLNNETSLPLHSHCQYHQSSQGSINSNLRLLNSQLKPVVKVKIVQNMDKFFKKPAFGCSQIRKIDIFQKKQERCKQQRQNQNLMNILQNITYHTKDKNIQQQITVPKQKNKLLHIFKSQKKNKTKIGFGVGDDFQRFSSVEMFHKKYKAPGPGTYDYPDNFNSPKIKNKENGELKNTINTIYHAKPIQQRLLNKINNSQQNFQNIKFKVGQPGPGSYQIPTFNSQNMDNIQKQKWKQKYMHKKNKTKQVLQKLNIFKKMKQISLQQQQKFKNNGRHSIDSIENSTNQETKNKVRQPMSQGNYKTKYLRNQLKDKTNNFLPKVEQIQYQNQNQNRGPIYKYLISNCFVKKNDHAFQAHYYKKPEQQSQYLFFKGGSPHKPQIQSCSFKSTTLRQPF